MNSLGNGEKGFRGFTIARGPKGKLKVILDTERTSFKDRGDAVDKIRDVMMKIMVRISRIAPDSCQLTPENINMLCDKLYDENSSATYGRRAGVWKKANATRKNKVRPKAMPEENV